MERKITVAAAQVGAIHADAIKRHTVQRLVRLLRQAAEQKVQLVVFPECTLTTFFPRHNLDPQELEKYFEHAEDITQSPDVKPLIDEARSRGIDIVLGYAERVADGKGYNTSVYFSASEGRVIGKYRKVHLPGTKEPFEDPAAMNQLEKRYFTPGNLGFPAFRAPGLLKNAVKKTSAFMQGENTAGKGDPIFGMLICNDRRWPEGWRLYGLQGAELVMYGFNTGSNLQHLRGSKSMLPSEAKIEALFQSRLVQQANSYMNACFSISSARCGLDDGEYDLIGGSAICSPEGHILAEAKTEDDELVVAEIDLGECKPGKSKTFNFEKHRRIETYGLIGTQPGVVEADLL